MREIFWQAFSNAEETGSDTVIAVANIMYQRWCEEIHELTDLVMVINHKSWDHYRNGNVEFQELYTDLYYEYYEKVLNYLEKNNKDDELTYFIRTLD